MKPQLFGIVLLSLAATLASAQATKLGTSCDLASQGAKEKQSFLAFDRDLRGVLSKPDAQRIALLVNFPLRVNTGRGSYSLNDPASLGVRFQEVFPADLRQIILQQPPEELSCGQDGVRYGDGELWVSLKHGHYAIDAVNMPDQGDYVDPADILKLACKAQGFSALIDQKGDDAPRLQLWNNGHSLLDKADIEITHGSQEWQGSGECMVPVWKFQRPGKKIVVDGVGCTDAHIPNGAVGDVTISDDGKPQAKQWCY